MRTSTPSRVKEESWKDCLNCDAWTSIFTEAYVTITAHFIPDAMYESHKGAKVVEFLQKVSEKLHLTIKDIVLVTDFCPKNGQHCSNG